MPHAIADWLTWKHGVTALPGYFIADTPWAGVKTTTPAIWARTQGSAILAGGYWANGNSGTINDLTASDVYAATGTFKLAAIYSKDSNYGIATWTLGATSFGTIDQYAAGHSDNNYTELTGVAITAGLYSLQAKAASKNASSAAYYIPISTVAIVRTGA